LGACNLRRDVVSIIEIRCELCGEDRSKGGGNDLLSRRLANLMNTMPGWTKQPKRKRVGVYGPQWVYRRNVPSRLGVEYEPSYVHDPRQEG